MVAVAGKTVRSIILFNRGAEAGWAPITRFAEMASVYFNADLHLEELRQPGRFRRLQLLAGRRRLPQAAPLCLVIARAAGDLADVLQVPGWRSRFHQVFGLITDSYWTDEIPVQVKHDRVFDHFFITSAEDLPEWRRKTGDRVSWLPWGSDTLQNGSARAEREWDVLRVGRQPEEWDDDEKNSAAAAGLGLAYHPRPAWGDNWRQDYRNTIAAYSSAKFLLAFSNTAHPTGYTHPVRQYLTGRWTDALACGTVVAGIPPREPSIDELLWPEATLDLGTVRQRKGLEILRHAVSSWTPATAELNHLKAMERLDWRWRLATIAERAGMKSALLESDIEELRGRIRKLASASSASPGSTA